jgi:hypothetical protein
MISPLEGVSEGLKNWVLFMAALRSMYFELRGRQDESTFYLAIATFQEGTEARIVEEGGKYYFDFEVVTSNRQSRDRRSGGSRGYPLRNVAALLRWLRVGIPAALDRLVADKTAATLVAYEQVKYRVEHGGKRPFPFHKYESGYSAFREFFKMEGDPQLIFDVKKDGEAHLTMVLDNESSWCDLTIDVLRPLSLSRAIADCLTAEIEKTPPMPIVRDPYWGIYDF